jgi:ADP-ribosylation factor-binding protein GGA
MVASGSAGGDSNGLSLIDLDVGSTDASANGTNGGDSGSGNAVDDLMGLFSQPPPPVNTSTRPPAMSSPFPTTAQPQPQPQFGSIMLPGTPTPSNGSTNGAAARTISPPGGYFGASSSTSLAMGSRMQAQSQTQATSAVGQAQFMSMMQPKPQNQPMGFASGSGLTATAGPRSSSLGAATPPSGPATPPGLGGLRTQTMGAIGGQRPQTQPGAAQGKDPFADLAGLF